MPLSYVPNPRFAEGGTFFLAKTMPVSAKTLEMKGERIVLKSIAAKIAIVASLLVIVVSVFLGLMAYRNGSSAVLNEVEESLLLQARGTSGFIDQTLSGELAALEMLAMRPEIQCMEPSLQQQTLDMVGRRLTEFMALGIVTPDGIAHYNDGTAPQVGDRTHVINAFAGEAGVSDVLASRADGTLVVTLAVPIKNAGEVVGVLLAKSDGTRLSETTDDSTEGSDYYAFIFDQEGTIIAHPNRQYVLDQRNLFRDSEDFGDVGRAVQDLGLGNTGIVRYNFEGSSRLTAITPIATRDWLVGVGIEENIVLSQVNQFRNILLLLAAVAVTIGVGASFLLGRHIAAPLQSVQNAMAAAAEGNFAQIVETRAKDEVGQVARALNATLASVSQALGLVNNTANELAGTSGRMAAASEEVSAAIEEVASTTNQFSSTLEGMNTNAQTMAANVQEISKKSSRGQAAITGIVEDVGALQANTAELAVNISDLGGLSHQIGPIVNVIDEIAEQTNLLALNAAIEAARAGEHGRGFAVVAEEVRKLAEQSSRATTEITGLIDQIQNGIAVAVTGMNQGAEQARDVSANVAESGKILNSILEDVEEIAAAVEAVSSGLEEANAGGREIAGASQQQAASVQEIAGSAQDLSTLGARLQELLGRFKLK